MSRPRIFEKPVAWLLGQQLLGGIKGMLLYTAYGAKLDPRDWMAPEEQNFATPAAEAKGEFWFDYMSDIGDGTKAMYGTAYLALSNLWTNLPGAGTSLPDGASPPEVSTTANGRTFSLPRGEFLFVGGDTAYHASDYLSLVNRIQRPFNYAYEDLKSQNLISDDDPRRPIFGIPGNHDYYDQIDGFRRQFRKPVRKEGPLPPKRAGGDHAQLSVAGFERSQQASYIALRLPFDWRLWGFDTESVSDRRDQHLDRRQEEFFKGLSRNGDRFKEPDKLIVATSAPSTIFGQVADPDDQKTSRPLKTLKIKRPFLPTNGDLATTGDAALDQGQCRLDLSGDVHHYARYWGPQAASTCREQNGAPRPSANSYASVVSGAGGAFHHPSTTYNNQICEQVLYPAEDKSRAAVADRIFKLWNVFTGGYVWLFGLIIAFTIYFGVTVPQSSRQFISNLGILNTLQLTRWERIQPTIFQPGEAPCAPVQALGLWTSLGVVTEPWQPGNCTPANPGFLFPEASTWPLDLRIGQAFIFLSLIGALVTLGLALFTKTIFDDTVSPFARQSPNGKVVPIVAGLALLTVLGLLTVQPYRDHITPFVSSLIVLYSLIVGITAVVMNVRYGEYLFRKSFVPPAEPGLKDSVTRFVDYYLPWVLWIVAITIISAGLWLFGKNNLPAYMISDIVFILVLAGTVGGILALSFMASGALLFGKSAVVRFVGKLLIGVWHLALQLFVPFVLVRLGSWLDWLLAVILLVLPIGLAKYLLARNSRFLIAALWFVYGAVVLTLPYTTRMFFPLPPVLPEMTGWWGLMPAVFAGAFGAVFCCLWTGWYFGICFAFNGHNNEVGGAARIEEFKELIRFRVTPQGLTGYVIALDGVSHIGELDQDGRTKDGRDLKPKLIDVFHLRPKA